MPATMLVGNLTVLVQLHSQHDLDVGAALVGLTQRPLGIVVVILFALVITTIVTQAFQFEAIRALEGYWKPGFTRSRIARWRIDAHLRKRTRLASARDHLLVEAYASARNKMVEQLRDLTQMAELQAILRSDDSDSAKIRRIRTADLEDLWALYIPASQRRRVDALENARIYYPSEQTTLPTVLGNTLRSYEEKLTELDGPLESFILREHGRTTQLLRAQHDEFRNRLDMYCALIFVFFVLAVLGPTLLLSISYIGAIGATVAYLLLATVSYSAAITTARGYGSILLAVDEERRSRKADHQGTQSSRRGYL